ncbi:ABC transporter ATP-binding protein [Mycoplasmopsis ciconiae]|uniref:ABC transporter ATP-binding protein n=1 Tax=Mycoplasmopsis ciconiae TaxID=561067 RepID=A0ABU7MKR2_9BACT|nr:ABC transporter ATP-binding protein [Mycoplasmopsis ciconiae]
MKLIKQNKKIFSLIFLILALVFLVNYFTLFFYQKLIKNITDTSADLWIYLALVLTSVIIMFIYNITKSFLRKTLVNFIHKKIFEKILKANPKNVSSKDNQKYFYLLSEGLLRYVSDYYMPILSFVLMSFELLGLVVALGVSSPITLSYTLPLLFVFLMIPFLMKKQINDASDLELEIIKKPLDKSLKFVNLITSYKSIDKQAHLIDLYKSDFGNKYLKTINKFSTKYMKLQTISGVSASLFFASLFLVGTLFFIYKPDLITISIYASVIFLSHSMSVNVTQAITNLTDIGIQKLKFKNNVESLGFEYKKLFDIVDFNQNSTQSLSAINLKDFNYQINENKKLKIDKLQINQNQKILINGQSGEGKSTLFLLLNKFLDHDQLVEYFDHQNNKIQNVSQKLPKVTIINKEMEFFEGSLKNNIIFSDRELNEQEANLIKLFDLDKLNFEEEVNVESPQYSLGQIQRLNLLRSLLSDNEWIFIDEAISNIDKKNLENIVNHLINSNKTIIMISHTLTQDLSDKFDKTYIIEKGELYEAN